MTIENPRLDQEELTRLERKISNKSASADDYEILDYFLSSRGLPEYIGKTLKDYGISTYTEYIERTQGLNDPINQKIINNVTGSALGIISFLKSNIL
jgi:hypothetical protein